MSFGNVIKKSYRATRDYFAEEKIDLLPRVGPFRDYTKSKFVCDMRAAANVTLLALPQAIAYAAIAGLDIVYGVISAAVAAIWSTVVRS